MKVRLLLLIFFFSGCMAFAQQWCIPVSQCVGRPCSTPCLIPGPNGVATPQLVTCAFVTSACTSSHAARNQLNSETVFHLQVKLLLPSVDTRTQTDIMEVNTVEEKYSDAQNRLTAEEIAQVEEWMHIIIPF
jgi:hypothetical protein